MVDDVAPACTLLRYAGRCGDRNGLGTAATGPLTAALADALALAPISIDGSPPEPAPREAWWSDELASARDDLRLLAREVGWVGGLGGVPVTVLPRCAAGLASIPAALRERPEAVLVWFDAHADLHVPATTTSGYLGGMALSGPLGLWDSGFGGDADRAAVLVGARDIDPGEEAVLESGRVAAVAPGPGLTARLQAAVGGRPVYVHLDLDVLEPGLLPLEYETPGGLTFAQLQEALAALAGSSELVGFEVAELQTAPDGRPVGLEGLVGALDPLLSAALAHRLLFHCSLPGEFDPSAAEQFSSTRGRTLDEVGFIHLSTWTQLRGTARRYYADVLGDLRVLVIDPERLPGDALRLEQTDGGWYPHLYAPLPTSAVIGIRAYPGA